MRRRALPGHGAEQLHSGVLPAYSGDKLRCACAAFTEKHSSVQISARAGSHKDLYDELRYGKIDLVLSDQRRAFSDTYENLVLAEQPAFVELSVRNPLSGQNGVSVEELKGTSRILAATKERRDAERRSYRDTLGLTSEEFLSAPDPQIARIPVVSNRGILPMEGTGWEDPLATALKRLPLLRGVAALLRWYRASWKNSNTT